MDITRETHRDTNETNQSPWDLGGSCFWRLNSPFGDTTLRGWNIQGARFLHASVSSRECFIEHFNHLIRFIRRVFRANNPCLCWRTSVKRKWMDLQFFAIAVSRKWSPSFQLVIFHVKETKMTDTQSSNLLYMSLLENKITSLFSTFIVLWLSRQ